MIIKTSNFYNSILNIFFPDKCIVCNKNLTGKDFDKRFVCYDCESRFPIISRRYCGRCGAPIDEIFFGGVNNDEIDSVICSNCKGLDFIFSKNESLYIYTGFARELIHKYKFEGRWRLYKYFSNKLIDAKYDYIKTFDFILSVPLTRKRLKERGYNQSSLIAKYISNKIGIKYLKNALYRKGHSKPQSLTKSIDDRYKNMKDVIKVNKRFLNKIKNSKILLFDDILTTGITASICARALYEKNAKNVSLLTIARTLR